MNETELMRLLESLTPGGSEFHDNPERCAEFIRDRMRTSARHAIGKMQAEKRLADLESDAFTSTDSKMKVIVIDNRDYPDYKNAQIVALFRNMLAGWCGKSWEEIDALSQEFNQAIFDADYLSDDVGRTWAMSYAPNHKESKT